VCGDAAKHLLCARKVFAREHLIGCYSDVKKNATPTELNSLGYCCHDLK